MMRIVIDLQGAQTESRFRGIGRYSLSLAKAIVRNRGEHEVIIALNGLFPDTIKPIRAEFNDFLPQENIRVWYAPAPVRECELGNTWRREAAELIREAFLMSLQPDIVHITSLFEGYVDNGVTSIGLFDQKTLISTSLYDLIPLLNPDQYFQHNQPYKEYYQRKIECLQRSSLLLSISEHSKQEGIKHLSNDSESIINISTAADKHFHPLSIDEEQQQTLRDKFDITRSVILYTGGADERKNLFRLIRAYATLPSELRNIHQLVFAGKMPEGNINQLQQEAKISGLHRDELIFTGYITDNELVTLYNICKLYVFPSWHEGFGLPALEAMSCGAAVIAANTSSLPEVIGNENALFNPLSEDAIANKITIILTNESFRQSLIEHGLNQAKQFSWDKSAALAIVSFEQFYRKHQRLITIEQSPKPRPKMAYISPLAPERSGISDYSAELLPELAHYYDIDVVVAQKDISDIWIKANCRVQTVEWFKQHADDYDRVLYHFGNSPLHSHMLELLEQVPGVVVLHDFFLPHIIAHIDAQQYKVGYWASELYHSHGYPAIKYLFTTEDTNDVNCKYPCNLSVLQNASGIIVHSKNSQYLAQEWYGSSVNNKFVHMPLLRAPNIKSDKNNAKKSLNFSEKDFIVCSFGLLAPTKLNHRLLDAWLNSALAKDKSSHLVFVGENEGGDYGQDLLRKIHKSGLNKRIHITGWTDAKVFKQYLTIADIGVQLRTQSRGETSAAVLDCMNYGIPTIVNANGSMADLPEDGCLKLVDNFCDEDLTVALEKLWQDVSQRQQLGEKAQQIIRTEHAPSNCAKQYFNAMEQFYREATIPSTLVKNIARLESPPHDTELYKNLAEAIDQSIAPSPSQRQLFIDISEIVQHDRKTGIERIVRNILHELLVNPPAGYRVEPVYAVTTQQGYRYARNFTLKFLNCPPDALQDSPISYRAGDIFLGLEVHHHLIISQESYLSQLKNYGVSLYFLVHDLLPITLAKYFPAKTADFHKQWLAIISKFDGLVCVSETTAFEVEKWLDKHYPERKETLKIAWSHSGSNIEVEASASSKGLPVDYKHVLTHLKNSYSFLMVGTLEPRKGCKQVLLAFDKLWSKGIEANLILVGKQGWMVDELISQIKNHPQLGERLFWSEGISDEYLEKIYKASTCLIAASEGEGFGLPLIEAAQYKLPIIARDIPIFREVAGQHAYYFNDETPYGLSKSIEEWLKLFHEQKHPTSDEMPLLTWKQSTDNLIDIILSND